MLYPAWQGSYPPTSWSCQSLAQTLPRDNRRRYTWRGQKDNFIIHHAEEKGEVSLLYYYTRIEKKWNFAESADQFRSDIDCSYKYKLRIEMIRPMVIIQYDIFTSDCDRRSYHIHRYIYIPSPRIHPPVWLLWSYLVHQIRSYPQLCDKYKQLKLSSFEIMMKQKLHTRVRRLLQLRTTSNMAKFYYIVWTLQYNKRNIDTTICKFLLWIDK